MNLYETTLVIDSLQRAEDMQNTITKIENFIQNNGGTIKKKEEWGKKRLAYEINRKQYGTYHHIIFEGPETLPGLLEREYRLEESILRYLTVISETELADEEAPAEPQAAEEEVAVAEPQTDKPEEGATAEAETKEEEATVETAEEEAPAKSE